MWRRKNGECVDVCQRRRMAVRPPSLLAESRVMIRGRVRAQGGCAGRAWLRSEGCVVAVSVSGAARSWYGGEALHVLIVASHQSDLPIELP